MWKDTLRTVCLIELQVSVQLQNTKYPVCPAVFHSVLRAVDSPVLEDQLLFLECYVIQFGNTTDFPTFSI